MSYNPVSGIVPQYTSTEGELASGYYLKFYVANTTTPLSMSVDSAGTTLLAKCKLNNKGMPISNPADNTTVFIPYVNQDYRLVIYANDVDADANTTGNAFANIASVSALAIAAGTPLFLETQTLTSGQVSVVFTNPTTRAVFYISGNDADSGRLVDGIDYTASHGTKTITLVDSYPVGTKLVMEYSTGNDVVATSAGSITYVGGTVESALNASSIDEIETTTLTSGQVSVVFSAAVNNGFFCIDGADTDSKRLKLTADYTVNTTTKTVTLVESYPAGSTLTLYNIVY